MIPLPAQNPDGSYSFTAGMQIDGDGANGQSSAPVYAPHGYTPEPLDFLANAGGPGNWYGVVTLHGQPLIQTADDPAPGAYIAATSYMTPGANSTDPRAYIDANAVPFIVIPSHWRAEAEGVVLGCKATVLDTHTGKLLDNAIVGDFGPNSKTGEASIAVARFFDVPCSPKNGGTDTPRFLYTFFPGVKADGFELIPA